MEVRQALPKEKDIVNTILIDAARWLQSIGSNQWSELLEGQDVHNTKQHIDDGHVYIAWEGDDPLAVFTLSDEQSEWDRQLWGRDSSFQYNYLHRLAINRKYAGQGLGSYLIQEIFDMTAKNNKKALRLDCNAEVSDLNRFYRSQGLQFMKRINNFPTGKEKIDFNLYQKEV